MNASRQDEEKGRCVDDDPVSGGGGQVLVEGGSGAEQEGGVVAEEGDGAENPSNVTKEGGDLFGQVADKKKLVNYQKYMEKINRERLAKPLPKHPKFGQPCPLSKDKLPTYGDVIRAILYSQSVLRLMNDLKQNPPVSQVVDALIEELETVANDFKDQRQVKRKQKLKEELMKVIKVISFWSKNKYIRSDQEALLKKPVIVYLKGKPQAMQEEHMIEQPVQEDMRMDLPEQEEHMLEDHMLEQPVQTEHAMEQPVREEHMMEEDELDENSWQESSSSQEPSSQASSSVQEWSTPPPPPPVTTPFRVFGTKTLKNTAEALDRFQIPPRQAAHLINSFQVDTVADGNIRDRLVDPSKLERDREKVRKEKLELQRGKIVTGLGVDGRKDKTLTRKIVTNDDGVKVLARCVKKKTDNVSVLSNP